MFLFIDKPKGITSHDVVDKIRKVTGERKVGHAGTLDPNASGLLILGVGKKSTKKLGEISKKTKKTYEGVVVLGESRDTDDIEGKVLVRSRRKEKPNIREVKRKVKSFEGKGTQIPPAFSAIRIKGKKAYELARKGKILNLPPRNIVVYSIEVLSYRYPRLEIRCVVSPGTYIRAIARDIGEKLKTEGYLTELRRTQIGKTKIEEALQLEDFDRKAWKKILDRHNVG